MCAVLQFYSLIFPFKHLGFTRNFVVFFASPELYSILAWDLVTTNFVTVGLFLGFHMSFKRCAFRLSSFPAVKQYSLRSDCGSLAFLLIPSYTVLHSFILRTQEACRDLYLFAELHVPTHMRIVLQLRLGSSFGLVR